MRNKELYKYFLQLPFHLHMDGMKRKIKLYKNNVKQTLSFNER
jgi:hypothetical protein